MTAPAAPPIKGLHHFAYKARDPEETRAFYEDVLGLPMTHIINTTGEPTTGGEPVHYFHFFFEMRDGSYLAFFDLGDDTASAPSPNTPPWINHLALEVGSLDELAEAQRRLEAAGVRVVGPRDHHFIKSIYFFDPNGIRLELTARTDQPGVLAAHRASAHREFDAWIEERAARTR